MVLISQHVLGQNVDTINTLKPYTKTTNRIIKDGVFSKIEKLTIVPIITINQNLGDLLQNQSINYLKNYGPGSLSSISSRGGNAQQTSLIYNDFLINNPLNGIVDFATIPTCFFNNVNVIYGLPSSNWGNGGLSAAVILENSKNDENKLEFEYGNTFGSFNQKTNFLSFYLNNEKFYTTTKVFHTKSLNNFNFKNQNLEIEKQTNSSINHLSLMTESKIILNESSNIKMVYFGQVLNREIPPSIYEGFTDAFQKDINHRLFFNYSILKEKYKIDLKSAFYDEENTYIDSARSVFGYNPSKSFINQTELKSIKNTNHNYTLNLTNSNAYSNGLNYDNKITINRISLTGSYIYSKKDWKQMLNVRVLADEKFLTPITFSYALNKKINNSLIYINAGKVYRLPSINDLFWNPGGNQQLLPEDGYSTDLGLKWKKQIKNTIVKFSPSLYSRWIKNWIQWQPQGNYWSAMNIKQVWSRGIETNTEFFSSIKEFKFQMNFKTSYNLSTNTDLFNDDLGLINKQLMYCPHYKAIIRSSFSFKSFNLIYSHNYTGYRFTSSDNLSYLPSFHLGNICLSSKFMFKGQSTELFYKLNNIYNSDYQLIVNRPMPLINHEIGINLKLHK